MRESVEVHTTAPGSPPLAENEVHVWTGPLDVPDAVRAGLAATLSAAEAQRAEQFKFDRHRNRFIAGRGWLRTTLARYLQVEAAGLEFVYSPHGKPALAARSNPAHLHFNLAHSDDLALLAITRTGPVGIDVEHVRLIKDLEDLVSRFFSRREDELFQALAPNKKPAAFFNLWTRKEALLKATGQGIGSALADVEVSFLPGEPARLLGIAGDTGKAVEWSLHDLSSANRLAAALAIQARNVRVRHCHSEGPVSDK
jgi:4'-phosphopantetheinyl transferase